MGFSRKGFPLKARVGRKVPAKPCPECGQLYSRQKLPLHIKERHQGGKRR